MFKLSHNCFQQMCIFINLKNVFIFYFGCFVCLFLFIDDNCMLLILMILNYNAMDKHKTKTRE